MSSQLRIYFTTEDPSDSDEMGVNFNIRHFRNYHRNKNDGVELDPCGGYTVLSEEGTGKMFVAKCNPKDKFNRKIGLKQAINHYLKCHLPEVRLYAFENVGKDEFVAVYGDPVYFDDLPS
jgi:hypothetical protein